MNNNPNLNPSSPPSRRPPKVTEEYEAIKLLGEGSYGKAYLVKGKITHEYFVIKTINIEKMNQKEKEEAKHESDVLRKMDHPNIIRFIDVFLSRKPVLSLNIVTEYADGGDLSQKIKSRQKNQYFSENQILDWFTQICLAIKHIHSKHIIHRDLKAQNIFLTKGGLIKLGDFGIAKSLQNTWQKCMTMVGTPYYLSPEIVMGNPYSFKSDIWSLGILLYEMTMLKVPFDANSLPLLSVKIMKGNYGGISSNFSGELKGLIDRLLCVDQKKRPDINEVLKMPIIKNRIRNFLNEVQYDNDFSKTLVKNLKNEKKKNNNNNSNNNSNNNNNKPQVPSSLITNINSNNSSNPNTPGNLNTNITNNNHPPINYVHYTDKQNNSKPINYHFKQNSQSISNSTLTQKEKEVKDTTPYSININNNNNNNNNPSTKFSQIKKVPTSSKNIHAKNINYPPQKNPTKIEKERKLISDLLSSGPIKKQESKHSPKKSSEPSTNPSSSSSSSSSLKEFIQKKRQELKKNPPQQTEDIPVIWVTNKQAMEQNLQKPKNNPNHFPDIIIVEKKVEEMYNQNRYLNNLNKIYNEDEEDSDNDNEEEDENTNENSNLNNNLNNKINNEHGNINSQNEREESIIMDNIENNSKNNKENLDNKDNNGNEGPTDGGEDNDFLDSDFTQIEEMKIQLENYLGFDLLKSIYKIVDNSVDTFNYDNITRQIKGELKGKFGEEDIGKGIEKIWEVFAVVSKERMSNM